MYQSFGTLVYITRFLPLSLPYTHTHTHSLCSSFISFLSFSFMGELLFISPSSVTFIGCTYEQRRLLQRITLHRVFWSEKMFSRNGVPRNSHIVFATFHIFIHQECWFSFPRWHTNGSKHMSDDTINNLRYIVRSHRSFVPFIDAQETGFEIFTRLPDLFPR